MNALLQQITDHAADDLKTLMEEGSEDILKAIHKTEEECQLQETAPKFSLAFKITVDLDKNTFDCNLGWSFKQSLAKSHQIEDPNQTNLPLSSQTADELASLAPQGSIKSVTISGGGTSVTIGTKEAEMLKKVAKELRKQGK